MEAALTADECRLVEAARDFVRDVVAPAAGAWEDARRVPREAWQQAAALGLTGLLVPRELGGAGASGTATARILEVLAAADMAFAFSLVVHNNLAGNIARNGSAAQIERYLPPFLATERIGAFLLTESGGGSDAAAIETRAQPTGDGWVLNGEKAWITNAAVAEVLSVYAQTDPAASWRGIACFLVEAGASGVVREAPYHMLGAHAMGTGGFRFEDCRLGPEALFIGPGEAFKAAMQGIDIARIVLAAMCCGMLGAGLEEALRQTGRRRAFGQRIADFQGVQWMLADVATELEAGRLLSYRAAELYDRGEAASVMAAHAKKFTSRAALKGLADCMQVMGAPGLDHASPLARHLAGAKIAHYLDGANEIQNVVISRSLQKEFA
ncbi:MAG: acyl-CoA dehydrogenase family protein [Alphaproteobacteria bacterium]|nr:acyl-CoA dehydrogenase family protein [Alphaproteobacteria bacterium]